MEIVSNVRFWGNGAGVLVPKNWNGKQVKVVLIDRTPEIKKEVFKIIDEYLPDVFGIYLVGSYARSEETSESDIDVIVISNKIKKEIISGKYHVSIYSLESIKKTLKKSPLMIYPRLIEAKAILNENLLNELKAVHLSINQFKQFFEDTKRILKINLEFMKLDKIDNEYLSSSGIIYSLILRLRGIFIVKSILERKKYTNKLFKQWLSKKINKENFEKVYRVYEDVKNNKKSKLKIKISLSEKLLELLGKEVKRYG